MFTVSSMYHNWPKTFTRCCEKIFPYKCAGTSRCSPGWSCEDGIPIYQSGWQCFIMIMIMIMIMLMMLMMMIKKDSMLCLFLAFFERIFCKSRVVRSNFLCLSWCCRDQNWFAGCIFCPTGRIPVNMFKTSHSPDVSGSNLSSTLQVLKCENINTTNINVHFWIF